MTPRQRARTLRRARVRGKGTRANCSDGMGGAEQDASMEDALDPLRRRLGLAVSAASLARRVEGRLVSARGVSLTALLPGARVGEVVRVARPGGEAFSGCIEPIASATRPRSINRLIGLTGRIARNFLLAYT